MKGPLKRIPRYCPLEDPPTLCWRECEMKPCELLSTCYACNKPLGFTATQPPALCKDCENLP